jgi:hypothetical protein
MLTEIQNSWVIKNNSKSTNNVILYLMTCFRITLSLDLL